METYFIMTYRYRDGLHADGYRELTKRFAEIGAGPSVIAHYSRLDGSGGVLVSKGQDVKDLEVTLEYLPWVAFESYPVTTIEAAFPVIQSVYG